MEKHITVIPGDGIGPEITRAAVTVLEAVAQRFGHTFTFSCALAGGTTIDAVGVPLPPETLNICRRSDAVLLGALGGPKWDNCPADIRPEAGLLALRQELGLYANLRPAVLYPALHRASPLKPELTAKGLDIL
ncbi:MAG: isocitrate/isopropylmalate family dehydrogenase, partial [Clostridia bacterium]